MKDSNGALPSVEVLEQELARVRTKNRFKNSLRSTVYALITVSAVAILVATLLFPILKIFGTSMTPALYEDDIVVSIKGSDFEQGDVISFYYNNKILVKRVIAYAGDWVDIDEDGIVYVNGEQLNEPYVQDYAFGDCDIELPYQVPDGKIFVMGDHRSTSQDSRTEAIGCVTEEQIVGRIVFRVWPLSGWGWIK